MRLPAELIDEILSHRPSYDEKSLRSCSLATKLEARHKTFLPKIKERGGWRLQSFRGRADGWRSILRETRLGATGRTELASP